MNDYLWDKSGTPDGDVEALEQLLQPLAHQPTPLSLPAPARRSRAWMWATLSVAAAAAIALFVMRPWTPRPPAWPVLVAGEGATIDGRVATGNVQLAVGALFDSGAARATVTVPGLGRVTLAANTRARIVATAPIAEMRLERGALQAVVTAPPRRFAVATPSLRVVDLGCAFSLTVDDAGAGTLAVTDGAVALGEGARQVVVPAGASCAFSQAGAGPLAITNPELARQTAQSHFAAEPATLRQVLGALDAAAKPQNAPSPMPSPSLPPSLPSPSPSLPVPSPSLPAPQKHVPPHSPARKPQHHKAANAQPAHVTPIATPAVTKPATQKTKAQPERLNHDALKNLENSIP